MQIDGRPAWEVLREFYPRLTDEDVASMVEAAAANPMMQIVPEHMRDGGISMMELFPHMADVEASSFSLSERVGMLPSRGSRTARSRTSIRCAARHGDGRKDGDEFHKVNVPTFVNPRSDVACLVECGGAAAVHDARQASVT